MADLNFLEHAVSSMSEAVNKLEEAKNKNDKNEVMRWKGFIFDLHKKIDSALGG